MTECFTSQSGTSLAFNILLHMFILFLFLSLLFKIFISKLETSKFQDEMASLIDENTTDALNNYSLTHADLKSNIKNNANLLNTLNQMYSVPDPVTNNNNDWVMSFDNVMLVLIALSILIVLCFLYFSCKKCINLKEVLLENLIIFACVGVIEYVFFTQIAFNYIPVPPSLLINTVYATAKQNLVGQTNS
jgi:hypothetical protein